LRAADPPETQLFKTNNVDFPARGSLRIGLGATILHGVAIPFSGLAGDLTQWGVLRVDFGLGDNFELQVRGIARQDLHIDRSRSNPVPPTDVTGDRTHDVGDFSIATLVKLSSERGRRPSVGCRIELKLPNTDDTNGIGTNTSDVFLSLLLEKRLGRFALFTDSGLGILSEPTVARSQNDVFVYGLGSEYALSSSLTLMSELYGRWAPSGSRPGTEDHSQLRGGIAWKTGRVTCELLLSRGLTRHDEKLGLALGVDALLRTKGGTW
jgi:hypothetical protein